MPQLIYSPWAKFCGKGQQADAKQVCFTGKDARTEGGVPVVAAALIEPDGEPTKIFRVTLPSPLQLKYGTRLIIDQQDPMQAQFFTCFSNGCMADYQGTPELIAKLKKGQMLTIQAINLAGSPISFPLPLTDFGKANEGPPTDPKVFEEQQKKLQEELQKRAVEARRKLEGSSLRRPLSNKHIPETMRVRWRIVELRRHERSRWRSDSFRRVCDLDIRGLRPGAAATLRPVRRWCSSS